MCICPCQGLGQSRAVAGPRRPCPPPPHCPLLGGVGSFCSWSLFIDLLSTRLPCAPAHGSGPTSHSRTEELQSTGGGEAHMSHLHSGRRHRPSLTEPPLAARPVVPCLRNMGICCCPHGALEQHPQCPGAGLRGAGSASPGLSLSDTFLAVRGGWGLQGLIWSSDGSKDT